jgi:replicative DNA helicase
VASEKVASITKLNEQVEQAKEQILKAKTGRKYTASNEESRREAYKRDRELRKIALAARVPFIDPETGIQLYPGLVLIGGVSGKGKTTLLANLLAGFVKHSQKKAVVVTNEESLGSLYDRVACVLTSLNFNKFYEGRLSPTDMGLVEDTAYELMKQVEVVDNPAYDMACMEDVESVLEHAANDHLGLVAVDYHQTVNSSRADPSLESFSVLKRLGFWLKDYSKRVPIPILNLVQLRKGSEGEEFKERIENDRTIYNHAFQCIEVLPDFDACQSTFRVVKDRYGQQQTQEIVMKYEAGRFVYDGGSL